MPPPLTSRRMALPVAVVILLALSLLPARYAVYGPPLHNAVLVVLGALSDPLHSLGAKFHVMPQLAAEQTMEQYQKRVLEMEGEIERLKEVNERLARENAQLTGLHRQFDRDKYALLPARVLGRSPDPAARTFLIDQGSRDGLAVNMAVVDGPYLLGRLVQVQHATAAVQPLTAPGGLFKVKLSGDPNRPILLKPAGPELLVAENADRKLKVAAGDLARLADDLGPNPWPTTAHSMIVGRVERVLPDPDNPLWQRIEVRPMRSLVQLNEVTVIVPNQGPSPDEGEGGEP